MIQVIQWMVLGKMLIVWAVWVRVQEGQQTSSDVIQIKALANTNTDTWPYEFVKVYPDNYLAGQNNGDYWYIRFWSCCY